MFWENIGRHYVSSSLSFGCLSKPLVDIFYAPLYGMVPLAVSFFRFFWICLLEYSNKKQAWTYLIWRALMPPVPYWKFKAKDDVSNVAWCNHKLQFHKLIIGTTFHPKIMNQPKEGPVCLKAVFLQSYQAALIKNSNKNKYSMNLPCVKDISHGHRAQSLAEGGGRSTMSSIKASQKERELSCSVRLS